MLKLFAKRPPTPVLDRTFGCEKARSLRTQFRSGKYRSVLRQLQRHPDVDQRSFYIDVLSEAEDRPPRFDEWIEEYPKAAEVRLVSGAQALEWAWQARGYGLGDEVTDEQWEAFHARLAFARRELEEALACDPSDPTAYGYLLRCARGESWQLADATELYRKATQGGEPLPWLASFQYCTFLCQKWYGSHEQMFEFARAASRSSPAGADVHAMVAYAHIERWLFASAFEENPHADEYWRASEVFDELIDVYKRWVNKAESSPYEKLAANVFLFCFSSLSGREVMRVELERIGPYPSFTPWRYLGDPVAVYREIWKLAHEK